jgi:hypothetical protein
VSQGVLSTVSDTGGYVQASCSARELDKQWCRRTQKLSCESRTWDSMSTAASQALGAILLSAGAVADKKAGPCSRGACATAVYWLSSTSRGANSVGLGSHLQDITF